MNKTQDWCDLCGEGIQPVEVNGPCIVMCSRCQSAVEEDK